MKLKKIASLALAGIMAVSMLTACGSTIDDTQKPNQPQEPAASDVVSAVEAGIKSWNSDLKIDVKSSNNMDKAIEQVFDSYTDYKDREFMVVTTLNTVFGLYSLDYKTGMTVADSSLVNTVGIIDQLNNENKSYVAGDTAWAYAMVPVTKVAFDTDAGDKIGHALEGLENVVESKTDAGAGKYEYMNVNYTLYVTAEDAVMANNNTNSYVIVVLKADYSARV